MTLLVTFSRRRGGFGSCDSRSLFPRAGTVKAGQSIRHGFGHLS
jgi:hypothetical protein